MSQIESLTLMLEKPNLKIEDLRMNGISLLVGQNGVGKTFCLINFWALTNILNTIVVSGAKDKDSSSDKKIAQFVYDHSFDDQKFTGKASATFGNNIFLEVIFNDGVVTKVNHNIIDNTKEVTPVIYMSSQMRTFNAISLYLKIRKKITSKEHFEIVSEMIKDFKLYDVIYIEGLIVKMPFNIPQEVSKILNDHFDFKENVESIDVDLDKCDFILKTSEGVKNLTSYSNGQQSILNMVINSNINT